MPTPSSEPPLDPSSPSSYNFSTCPDELQHLSHISQTSHEEMTPGLQSTPNRRSQSPRDAPSVDSEQSRIMIREDSQVTDDRISAEPSSRATTVSPPPRSSAAGATSPPPDVGNNKQQELERRLGTGQKAAIGSPSPASISSRKETDDNESETCDDDTQSSCYTGLDYSNKRVRIVVPFHQAGS
ncbi:hypothetical protein MY4824_009121 [Beauveria thailandica]